MNIGETRLIYNRFCKLAIIVAGNRNCPRKKSGTPSAKLLKTKTPHNCVAFVGENRVLRAFHHVEEIVVGFGHGQVLMRFFPKFKHGISSKYSLPFILPYF